MSDIINKVIWKTSDGENASAIVFRRKLEKLFDEFEENTDADNNNEIQNHLQQAMIYAKTQMLDSNIKSVYEKGIDNSFKTAYTIAVADFLNAPDISEIDLTNYQGRIGDTIRVKVIDDFKVKFVKINIYNQNGVLLERGHAFNQGDYWLYTIVKENDNLDGDKIIIQASDIPGNLTEKQQIIS